MSSMNQTKCPECRLAPMSTPKDGTWACGLCGARGQNGKREADEDDYTRLRSAQTALLTAWME